MSQYPSLEFSEKACVLPRLVFLDAIRALAALYVLMHHAVFFLWRPSPLSAHWMQSARNLTWIVFSHGYEAVQVFFVLSGFVIHYRYRKPSQLLQSQPLKSFYFYARMRRLYPPLLLAMTLTFVLDSLGTQLGFSVYSSATPFVDINLLPPPRYDAMTGLGNLTFLMDTYVPVWGTNHPLWSLKLEWWFYMLYPLIFYSARGSTFVSTIIFFLFSAAGYLLPDVLPRLLSEVGVAMIVWWCGVLVAEVYCHNKKDRLIGMSLGFVVIGCTLACFVPYGFAFYRCALASFFAAIMSAILVIHQSGVFIRLPRFLKISANMSYTIYVIHVPILIFLLGSVLWFNPDADELGQPLWLVISLFLVMVLAYICHFWVEPPFTGIKKLVALASSFKRPQQTG